MDLKEEQVLGDAAASHWYYRAKSAAMLQTLGDSPIRQVLDVGAGSGFFSRQVLDRTEAGGAICVDPNYDRERGERQNGKPVSFVRGIDMFDGDLVLMMDVLEHVPDDTALLAEYAAKVGAGTRFLLTVPAHMWMWSSHDVFLEHYRRYTIGQVDALVSRAGLTLIGSSYYFGLTLPMAAGVRLGRRLNPFRKERPGSDMKRHGAAVNAALWKLSRAELRLLGRNRMAGLSVFALARR